MWRRSLFARTLGSHLLAVGVALLLSGLSLLLLVARNERARLVERLEARASVYATYAAEIAPSTTILEGLAAAIVGRFPPEPDTSVRIFAPNGALLTGESGLGPFPSRAVQPYITGQLPFLPLSPATRLAIAQPIRRGDQTIGIVEVSADATGSTRLRRDLLPELLPAALLALAGATLMASLLARNLLRPLAALQGVAGSIAAGHLQARADDRRPDEIGRLAAEINRMAAELETRFSEVEQLANARREFYRTVSHELRTPLTAIRGIAENLEDSVAEQDRASLLIIQSETERLGRLVDELLAGGEPAATIRRHQPILMASLVQEVVDLMRPRAERGGIRLDYQPQAGEQVAGDRDRLKQALVNLLDNALKWTPPGGTVRVTLALAPTSTDLLLTVADTGPGIPEHVRSTVWQRGTRGADGGQGLGLAQVQDVVVAHAGIVRLVDGPDTAIELRLPTIAVKAAVR